MSVGVAQVLIDLVAEQDELDAALSTIGADLWRVQTASPRWSVADQIGHLAYFDGTAAQAINDPDAFRTEVAELLAHADTRNGPSLDEVTLSPFRSMTPNELLDAWRNNRGRLAEAAATLEDDTRVIWYGPSMGAKSFLTARLMECWAHGQDAIDAVGLVRAPSDRLAHIARLGFITRGWSYVNRGLEVPNSDVEVRLTAPSGDEWSFGVVGAEQRILGTAADFCLVVTQRRHFDDTDLVVDGDDARDWMCKAQVFAGPATDGPAAATPSG